MFQVNGVIRQNVLIHARVMVICVSNYLKAGFQNVPMIKGGLSVCDRLKLTPACSFQRLSSR